MRTRVITAKIVESLLKNDDEPLTTTAILDYVNDNSRHGATMGQIANILSKSPSFMDLGAVKVQGVAGSYDNRLWIFVGLQGDVFTKDLSLNPDNSVNWR